MKLKILNSVGVIDVRRLLPAAVVAAALASGCTEKVDDNYNADAERLYESSLRLAKVYADSMANAADSAAAESLMERFDERLTALNYSVAPDTDFHVSEGHNDTLAIALEKVRHIFDKRLYRFAHPQAADSISGDSISSVAARDSLAGRRPGVASRNANNQTSAPSATSRK